MYGSILVRSWFDPRLHPGSTLARPWFDDGSILDRPWFDPGLTPRTSSRPGSWCIRSMTLFRFWFDPWFDPGSIRADHMPIRASTLASPWFNPGLHAAQSGFDPGSTLMQTWLDAGSFRVRFHAGEILVRSVVRPLRDAGSTLVQSWFDPGSIKLRSCKSGVFQPRFEPGSILGWT